MQEKGGKFVIRLRKGIEESYNRGVSDKHFNRNPIAPN